MSQLNMHHVRFGLHVLDLFKTCSERYSRLKELYEFQQQLVELRLCTTDGRSWEVELHHGTTLRDAVENARSTIPSSTALEHASGDGVGDPYSSAGGAVEWRLRHFSPMTGRAGQTFATNVLDSSLVRTNSSKLTHLACVASLVCTLPGARLLTSLLQRTGRYWTGTHRHRGPSF